MRCCCLQSGYQSNSVLEMWLRVLNAYYNLRAMPLPCHSRIKNEKEKWSLLSLLSQVLSLKMCLHTDLLQHCNLIQSAEAEGKHTEKESELHSREEKESNRGEEVGISAPVSTTGILGLIIQMWMLLLENTRSRAEALSSALDHKQNIAQSPGRHI